ncbi:hypothetical protein ACWDTD_08425 [Gordonia sp. NPDC003425]
MACRADGGTTYHFFDAAGNPDWNEIAAHKDAFDQFVRRHPGLGRDISGYGKDFGEGMANKTIDESDGPDPAPDPRRPN